MVVTVDFTTQPAVPAELISFYRIREPQIARARRRQIPTPHAVQAEQQLTMGASSVISSQGTRWHATGNTRRHHGVCGRGRRSGDKSPRRKRILPRERSSGPPTVPDLPPPSTYHNQASQQEYRKILNRSCDVLFWEKRPLHQPGCDLSHCAGCFSLIRPWQVRPEQSGCLFAGCCQTLLRHRIWTESPYCDDGHQDEQGQHHQLRDGKRRFLLSGSDRF